MPLCLGLCAETPPRFRRERTVNEHYQQDKYRYAIFTSLFRIVCRNATKVLKRKDSSGSILKDGQLRLADYTHSLYSGNVSAVFVYRTSVHVVLSTQWYRNYSYG